MSSLYVIYGQLAIAAAGVVIQMLVARLNNKSTEKRARDTLEVRKLESARSVNAFIADKRQIWIDELRKDMAHYLALSQEIAWKWDACRAEVDEYYDELILTTNNESLVVEMVNEFRIKKVREMSEINGQNDRLHQETHIRIKFRLNPREDEHINLRVMMDNMRIDLSVIQSETFHAKHAELINSVINKVEEGSRLTEIILKKEWEKVKAEVKAYE
ncbi:hypothetical protein ACUN9V_09505 [Salinicola sp. V024]|uniref:hypothetical protein n=1 Tax=Salinicola sp. V024 TaxID=3459609 RepID=UPI0040447F7B